MIPPVTPALAVIVLLAEVSGAVSAAIVVRWLCRGEILWLRTRLDIQCSFASSAIGILVKSEAPQLYPLDLNHAESAR